MYKRSLYLGGEWSFHSFNVARKPEKKYKRAWGRAAMARRPVFRYEKVYAEGRGGRERERGARGWE